MATGEPFHEQYRAIRTAMAREVWIREDAVLVDDDAGHAAVLARV